MRFVTFQSAACDAPVSVQVSLVQAVGAKSGRQDGEWIPDQSVLVMTADAIVVHGSVADVVAALEAASAPAVAPAVEFVPTDLDAAASVLEILAREATRKGFEEVEVDHNDRALGLSDDDSSCSWDTTIRTLNELAARLRDAR
jgi:hypothetical protein